MSTNLYPLAVDELAAAIAHGRRRVERRVELGFARLGEYSTTSAAWEELARAVEAADIWRRVDRAVEAERTAAELADEPITEPEALLIALRLVVDDLQRSLVENAYRGTSSDPFERALVEVRRALASEFVRTYTVELDRVSG